MDLIGTFYETPQNHLVDFLTLFTQVTKGNIAEKFVKTTAILRFAYTQSRRIPAVTHIFLRSRSVACAKKCLYAVLLNANNIRLLTKCDAALLSFRYTSLRLILPELMTYVTKIYQIGVYMLS